MTRKCLLCLSLLLLLTVLSSGCVGITTAVGTAQADARSGNGLSISTSSLNFGNVYLGSSGTLTLKLTDSGQSTITISNTSVSGPGFNATGVPSGTILAPGQSAILSVTFAPAATGNAIGSVAITSNASTSPATVGLVGTGAQSTGNQSPSGGAATSITVTPLDPIIVPGSQLQFRAIDNLGNDITSTVVWASSNTSIATITTGGLATALADGDVTITATE